VERAARDEREAMTYAPYKICECGEAIVNSPTSHKMGRWHSEHRRIVALLKKDCLTFTDIGGRLGVTGERVRQIALKMGASENGFARMKSCTIKRKENAKEKALKKGSAYWQRVLPVGMTDGFVIQPVLRTSLAMAHRTLIVNGWLCRFYRNDNPAFGYARISAATNKDKVDFIIYHPGIAWLIIPWDKRPLKGTTFSFSPDRRYGTKSGRHDWLNYLNAWHFLKEPRP